MSKIRLTTLAIGGLAFLVAATRPGTATADHSPECIIWDIKDSCDATVVKATFDHKPERDAKLVIKIRNLVESEQEVVALVGGCSFHIPVDLHGFGKGTFSGRELDNLILEVNPLMVITDGTTVLASGRGEPK